MNDTITQAIDRHNPSHVFAMFSGGHDSLCATHVAHEHITDRPLAVAHINTGIGIGRTRDYVWETCRMQGWELLEYEPPVSYQELVRTWGFPGPAGHSLMYQRLKERCIRRLVREHKTHWGDRIGLITGVRFDESVRRMGTTERINRDGAQLWIAPIADWTDADKNAYMRRHKLPRNEVVDLMHMSGECLCGAFAYDGELDDWRALYPDEPAVQEIVALQAELRGAGEPACRWGKRPPAPIPEGQTHFLHLCQHCENWRTGS